MRRLLALPGTPRSDASHADADEAVTAASMLALRSSIPRRMWHVPGGAPPDSFLPRPTISVNGIKRCSRAASYARFTSTTTLLLASY